MATTIKTREYLFREKPRRGRNLAALALIAAGALGAATLTDIGEAVAEAPDTQDTTPAVYATVGGAERFVLALTAEGGQLRFLCREADLACTPSPVATLDRVAVAGGGAILRDAEGVPVLRIAKGGDLRLLGGSEAVPAALPTQGRIALRTEARAS